MSSRGKKKTQRRDGGNEREKNMDSDFGFWAVAFLDLLGYSKVLESMHAVPIEKMDEQSFQIAAGSFKAAVKFRKRLVNFSRDMRADVEEIQDPKLRSLSPEAQAQLRRWRTRKLQQFDGADHIILACALAPEPPSHFPAMGVQDIVTNASILSLTSLAFDVDDKFGRLPIRGGIDVGLGGLEGEPPVLHSAAVARAYRLESKTAIYPRVVASERLLQFLDSEPGAGIDEQYAKRLNKKVRAHFIEDEDGQVFLDFIGEALRKKVPLSSAKHLVEQAWSYVQGIVAAGVTDRSIRLKYEWLANYIESRLHLWEIATPKATLPRVLKLPAAKLIDLFPPQHPDTPWLFPLMVIRDDLNHENEGIWLDEGASDDEAWSTNYHLRRITLSLLEAKHIFTNRLQRVIKKPQDVILKHVEERVRSVVKELEDVESFIEAIRHAVSGHMNMQDVPGVIAEAPKLAGDIAVSCSDDTSRTSFRRLTSSSLLFAWPDATTDQAVEAKHVELRAIVSRTAKSVMQIIDLMLVRHWHSLGFVGLPENVDLVVYNKKGQPKVVPPLAPSVGPNSSAPEQ